MSQIINYLYVSSQMAAWLLFRFNLSINNYIWTTKITYIAYKKNNKNAWHTKYHNVLMCLNCRLIQSENSVEFHDPLTLFNDKMSTMNLPSSPHIYIYIHIYYSK